MSRAKQMSDVEDTSHRQTTHGSVGPTDPFGVVHREVNHRFISLRSFALDRKVSKNFGYSKKIMDSLHRVKFL
jgi:hypothetical protein